MRLPRIGIIGLVSFVVFAIWRNRESLYSSVQSFRSGKGARDGEGKLNDESTKIAQSDKVTHDASHRRSNKLRRAMPPTEVAI